MSVNEAVIKRITDLCEQQNINYYTLSYRAAVPKSTVMNILYGTNPTIGTISKICNGFNITLANFFDSQYFDNCEERE